MNKSRFEGVECSLAALLVLGQLACFAAPALAAPGVPGPEQLESLSRRISHAQKARIDTPDCRAFVSSPHASLAGVSYDSLVAPVPTNALLLPKPIPWDRVQEIQVRGHSHVPLALGITALGAVLGHLVWNSSSRSVLIDGTQVQLKDRQALYIVVGISAGMIAGMAANFASSRFHTIYRAP